ncbi:ATP-binding cassette domain-containing protein [Romboutsia weinsteinii]|uniref:ATP-binding cassette domain-containing protein n=1 Tax=Romboutsia weinsteinii TaxID=2020949 RepID=A0A371J596_9FIRM|nr:ABC transporter ATP-binding protein [Romboutsia weinsteinii]RDY27863.1 ATP-binding cassette domain-containing protein [Romboutsia weinsteinii]
MSFISVEKVNFSYPNCNTKALKDICLEIEKGELVLIIGPSGSGKSTLLSLLKHEISPTGKLSGQILIDEKKVDECKFYEIGYLFQNPNSQLVSDNVYHELIYSLKNINLNEDEINERLGEIVTYLNLNSILHSKVQNLSGGNKQIVNIASLLLMYPKVLILDEPTSQIDPIHYDEIMNLVLKLNKESNMTTIITEHRYDNIFYQVDKVVFINDSKVLLCDEPKKFVETVYKHNIEEIKPFLKGIVDDNQKKLPDIEDKLTGEKILKVKDVSFTYDNKILNLNNVDFEACEGEIISIVGSNGCGKTTFLKLLSGIYYPISGSIKIYNKKYKKIKNDLWKLIGYVPQDVNEFFTFDTIKDEFEFLERKMGDSFDNELYKILKSQYNFEKFLDKHPIDVSGGEKQLIIIILQLLKKSKILILDEPTKGLDPILKERLGKTLVEISKGKGLIILVSHDIDFIYKYSHKCCMMFNHKITKPVNIDKFFEKKLFFLPNSLKDRRKIV